MCEAVSALFHVPAEALNEEDSVQDWQVTPIRLDGNPLDLTVTDRGSVIISIDNVHERNSTTAVRSGEDLVGTFPRRYLLINRE